MFEQPTAATPAWGAGLVSAGRGGEVQRGPRWAWPCRASWPARSRWPPGPGERNIAQPPHGDRCPPYGRQAI